MQFTIPLSRYILSYYYFYYLPHCRHENGFNLDTNTGNASKEILRNMSFRTFLLSTTVPEYVNVVPNHWLEQDPPLREAQVLISTIFFCISVAGNICQLLVMAAYTR